MAGWLKAVVLKINQMIARLFRSPSYALLDSWFFLLFGNIRDTNGGTERIGFLLGRLSVAPAVRTRRLSESQRSGR